MVETKPLGGDAPNPVRLSIVLEARLIAAELLLPRNRLFQFFIALASESEMRPLQSLAR